MLQPTQSALRVGRDAGGSSLRPTIYRPSRPAPRITTPDPRDADVIRGPVRTVTPERGRSTVKPS